MATIKHTTPARRQSPDGAVHNDDRAVQTSPRAKRITVSTATYPPVEPYRHCKPFQQVPYIRLKGHWLTRGGFVPGTKFDVRFVDGCIVMVPV
jgi:hypothetical protein